MALEFKVYEGTTLTDLGTVAQLVGKRGQLAFIPKNLETMALNKSGVRKAVSVVLLKADGTSESVPCSQAISVDIRRAIENGVKKGRLLAIISKLSILENAEGHNFICAPAGESAGLETFAVEELAKEKAATYEDLLTF